MCWVLDVALPRAECLLHTGDQDGERHLGRAGGWAVMSRRLLETLLIEAFETLGEADALKDGEGNFRMLSGMLAVVDGSNQIALSRNGMKGLRDFKRLGDLSAHNRRFNARKDDIERIRDGIRIVSEELLHAANLK